MTATATKKKPRSRSRNFAADWDDGDIPTPQSAIDGIADELELPGDFPAAVIEAAEAAPSDVSEDEFRGRRDLTQTPLITMDGEDARDFDDAIFAEKINGGFRLVVAIADVSRYITTGGILDKEAMRRGNSVYLPDRVLPMLPLPYSAGICSLVPNEIRLCMCAEMEINGEGEIVRYRFFQGVMKSHRRLTYEKAAEMLEDSAAEKKRPEQQWLQRLLCDLRDLFQILADARIRRGALDLEIPETKPTIKNGKAMAPMKIHRTIAHRIVEECMLAANICAADYLEKSKMPSLFRIHAPPPADGLATLRGVLAGLGMPGLKPKPRPADLAALIQAAEKRDPALAQALAPAILRTMSRAEYGTKNLGHYGLAYSRYAHFTSPIRRYADLLAHRAVKAAIRGEALRPPKRLESLGEKLGDLESRADKAERIAASRLNCLWLREKVGEEFEAVVVNVVAFGCFIALESGAEGLVHISSFPRGRWKFDPQRLRLVGSSSTYGLGNRLRVRLVRADLRNYRLDFVPADF